MKDLEERYSTKYRVSLLGNLERIKQEGLGAFLKSEEAKWLCPGCGGTVCVHTGDCLQCKN
jgi:hypothetical protein